MDAAASYTYTLTVTNNGPGTAADVVITDLLPGEVTYVSSSDGGTELTGTVTWPAVTLTNGQFVTRTVTVTAPGTGTLDNVAQATAATADPDVTNNNGTNVGSQVSTTVNGADVEVAKAGPAAATAGSDYTYTLTVTNNGPGTAADVVITDVLPGAVTYVSASDGGSELSGTVSWPAVTLTNGQSVMRTVTVTAPASGMVSNVAQATAVTTDPDATNNDGSNPGAQVSTTIGDAADVLVTKTGPATIGAGSEYSYTVTATNNGPSAAVDVVLTDALPVEVTYVSASNGGTESGGTVTWPAVTLTNGQNVMYTVTVTAPGTSGTLNNVAQATATTLDPDATNNDGSNAAAQVSTIIGDAADVMVTKTGPATVSSVATYTYTITVTNNGPSTATGVVITDALPGAVTFVSASSFGTQSAGT